MKQHAFTPASIIRHTVYYGSMNTFMKADIFFFVATIATIVWVILGSIALVYLIKILRTIKRATDSIEARITDASEKLDALGEQISQSSIFRMIFGGGKKRRNKAE
jgi:beta-lactamase regulating signal transducer with metallopeptidase domain